MIFNSRGGNDSSWPKIINISKKWHFEILSVGTFLSKVTKNDKKTCFFCFLCFFKKILAPFIEKTGFAKCTKSSRCLHFERFKATESSIYSVLMAILYWVFRFWKNCVFYLDRYAYCIFIVIFHKKHEKTRFFSPIFTLSRYAYWESESHNARKGEIAFRSRSDWTHLKLVRCRIEHTRSPSPVKSREIPVKWHCSGRRPTADGFLGKFLGMVCSKKKTDTSRQEFDD